MDEMIVDGETVIVVGREQCLVESRSEPGTHHCVEWSEDEIRWVCTCMGWQVRKQCRHVRAVSNWAAGRAKVERKETV